MIGAPALIIAPLVIYINYFDEIQDADKLQDAKFKNELITKVTDYTSRVGKGRRYAFQVSDNSDIEYPISPEDVRELGDITVDLYISKDRNSGNFKIINNGKEYEFIIPNIREHRNLHSLIVFLFAFAWAAVLVLLSYIKDKQELDAAARRKAPNSIQDPLIP